MLKKIGLCLHRSCCLSASHSSALISFSVTVFQKFFRFFLQINSVAVFLTPPHSFPSHTYHSRFSHSKTSQASFFLPTHPLFSIVHYDQNRFPIFNLYIYSTKALPYQIEWCYQLFVSSLWLKLRHYGSFQPPVSTY